MSLAYVVVIRWRLLPMNGACITVMPIQRLRLRSSPPSVSNAARHRHMGLGRRVLRWETYHGGDGCLRARVDVCVKVSLCCSWACAQRRGPCIGAACNDRCLQFCNHPFPPPNLSLFPLSLTHGLPSGACVGRARASAHAASYKVRDGVGEAPRHSPALCGTPYILVVCVMRYVCIFISTHTCRYGCGQVNVCVFMCT